MELNGIKGSFADIGLKCGVERFANVPDNEGMGMQVSNK